LTGFFAIHLWLSRFPSEGLSMFGKFANSVLTALRRVYDPGATTGVPAQHVPPTDETRKQWVTPPYPQPATPPGELPDPFGRYRIISRLGRGGMGSVHLAYDTMLHRHVALKVPHFAAAGSDDLERFYREARAAAQLFHPNLCPVYEVDHVGATHYLTMPYIEGRTLADRIKDGSPFPPAVAVALVRRLAEAMHVAHRAGIVHRDLKPANVMVKPDGDLVVMDFGLARRESDKRLTAAGVGLGTPLYMAPEQMNGNTVGPAADVWAAGVILYELLTGRPPFDGVGEPLIFQIGFRDPRPPSELRPEVGPELDTIAMWAMAKRPADRFPSMGAFASALEAV
jgi:serine/threonine-protein kinase